VSSKAKRLVGNNLPPRPKQQSHRESNLLSQLQSFSQKTQASLQKDPSFETLRSRKGCTRNNSAYRDINCEQITLTGKGEPDLLVEQVDINDCRLKRDDSVDLNAYVKTITEEGSDNVPSHRSSPFKDQKMRNLRLPVYRFFLSKEEQTNNSDTGSSSSDVGEEPEPLSSMPSAHPMKSLSKGPGEFLS